MISDPVFRSPFKFSCYFSKRHFLQIIFWYYHFFKWSHLRIINAKLISPSTPASYGIPISKSVGLHLLWYIRPVSAPILLIYFDKGLIFLFEIINVVKFLLVFWTYLFGPPSKSISLPQLEILKILILNDLDFRVVFGLILFFFQKHLWLRDVLLLVDNYFAFYGEMQNI